MKSISEIKAGLLNGKTLSSDAMSLVKGGAGNGNGTNSTSAKDDDKRRERPGGGPTTL